MRKYSQSIARGFTLVELLVVIGIIAVLISVLLPALNAARESAASARCLAHIRQLSMTMMLYAQDNHGAIPYAKHNKTAVEYPPTATPINVTWIEPLLPYLEPKFKAINNPNPANLSDRGRSILFGCSVWLRNWPQNGGSDPNRMPGYGMNILPKTPDDFAGFPAVSGSANNQVWINWYEPGINRFGRPTRLTDWKRPSERAMFGDARGAQLYVNPPSGIIPGTTSIDFRHNRKRYANIALWDGSASSMLNADARWSVRFKKP